MSVWVRTGSNSSKLPSQTRSALSFLSASSGMLAICCPCAACCFACPSAIHSGGCSGQAACADCVCCCCTPRCCRTTSCRRPSACCAATCIPTPSGEPLRWACAAAMARHPTATAPAVLHQLHSKIWEVEPPLAIFLCRAGTAWRRCCTPLSATLPMGCAGAACGCCPAAPAAVQSRALSGACNSLRCCASRPLVHHRSARTGPPCLFMTHRSGLAGGRACLSSVRSGAARTTSPPPTHTRQQVCAAGG